MLTFVIPVRHPENTKDRFQAKQFLAETIQSISAQTSDRWRAVIVANHGTDLPPLPAQFDVCFVDFPPNRLFDRGNATQEEWREAVRIDKGKRALRGMLFDTSAEYYMLVDDDDLVSSRLTQFVDQNSGKSGWFFKQGYLWETGGRLLYLYDDFSKFCGTSHIIRRDLYELPPSAESATDEHIKTMLGSHIFIEPMLEKAGKALEPLPFPGAIYRIGHTGAHSRSSGLLRKVFWNRSLLKNPARLVGSIFRLRPFTAQIRKQFFGLYL